MKIFDVIICGAGPAGTTCALALANSNLTVAVVEKASFPRSKVCGDAVAAYVPKVLHSIHPKYAKSLENFDARTLVNNCRIIAPNGKQVDVKSAEHGFIATRMEWDNFLYKLASAEKNISWFLQHEITDINVDKQAGVATVIAADKILQAKLVIGCDGAHSLAGKKLTGEATNLNHYSGAVRAYYKNVSGFSEGTYELHFMENILPGYFWIFPLPNNIANIGLCIPSKTIAERKINLRKTMEEIITNHPAIKYRFADAKISGKIEGYGLPLGPNKKQISGDHFMLCGDAASLIDPATGEGIGQSMISGRYAAWQAIKCFEQQNFSARFMKQYDKQLRKKLQWDFTKSHYTQWWIFNNKRIFNACFNFLDRNRFIKERIIGKIVKV